MPEAWWWSVELEVEALAVCRRCSVQRECLDYALAADEQAGFWGAATADTRASLRRRAS
jgi:WhiB family redox-sensing transcriptional regulator